ncbi:MAG: hypothetical protein HDQ87_11220 [Clostridia bacterium]|nr:hypothetical protein [Clostridia bacterium]
MTDCKIRNADLDSLLDAVVTLETREEAYRLFEDLCTAAELSAMAQRFRLAVMLRNKATHQQIVEQTGSSTATVARVSRCLRHGAGGYALVMDRRERVERTDGAE